MRKKKTKEDKVGIWGVVWEMTEKLVLSKTAGSESDDELIMLLLVGESEASEKEEKKEKSG